MKRPWLAEYRCGCTFVGKKKDCLEYCARHGEDRRLLTPMLDPEPDEDCGWDFDIHERNEH